MDINMAWFQKKTGSDSTTSYGDSAAAASPSAPPIPRNRTMPVFAHHPSECYSTLEETMFSDPKASGVVLKIYIENFKRLNEVFGYHYCEHLLALIITYLEEKTGFAVQRYIGVEFLVILEQYTQGKACTLADEILERFDNAWSIENTDCLCSVQIGMCSYPGHAVDTDAMLKCLDTAITKAGDCGPNQAVMFDSILHAEFIRKQAIAKYLQTALANSEIEVRYRPTYDAAKQAFTRGEYYMRIFIRGVGMVGTAEFLPLAEDSGQVRAVEYFALNHVGACIAKLIKAGKEFDSISLPISSILFLQADFLDKIAEIIETYQIPKGKLALEITEDAFTTAYLNINIMLQELADLGVELILNNFGSGYSNITSLLELPVNLLKLERMFIWQLETNHKSSHIIKGLVQIAHAVGLEIIAEGVETDRQIELLNQFGCNLQQGFYYSPTLSEETLIDVMGASLEDSRMRLQVEKEQMKR